MSRPHDLPAAALALLTSRRDRKKAELDALTERPPVPGYDRAKHQLEVEYWLLKELVDEVAAL